MPDPTCYRHGCDCGAEPCAYDDEPMPGDHLAPTYDNAPASEPSFAASQALDAHLGRDWTRLAFLTRYMTPTETKEYALLLDMHMAANRRD